MTVPLAEPGLTAGARRHLFACAFAVAAACLLCASPGLAQATGKIEGRVYEAETGTPIRSATVRVLGTGRGALSGEDGYYFINEVPAGLQTIIAEFIGRRPFRLERQRVLAGQTTTLHFSLEIAPIELDPLIVEGELNPLVPRDQVSSKTIVTGELVDELPVDDPREIVLLQPGVVTTNQWRCQGSTFVVGARGDGPCFDEDRGALRTIRGSRPNEEAVYVDGVLTRNYSLGTSEPLELPTNALAEVGVTTGGFGAQFGEAQSGVVNYVTRSGGQRYGGSLALFTDQLGPSDWRTGFHRLEVTFGGPLSRSRSLSFFIAGQLEGQRYRPLNDGFKHVPILVPAGVAQLDDGSPAVFRLPRDSKAADAVDSVDVSFPNYVRWNQGPTQPFNPNDEYTVLGRLSWGLGASSSLDLSYKRERQQEINRGMSDLYNPQGYFGNFRTAEVLTLGGYFPLWKPASHAVALDFKASYQKYFWQHGQLDPDWLVGHRDPPLGFNFSDMQFLVDTDDWPVTEALIQGVRSGAIPPDSLQIYPGRFDLNWSQSLPGLKDNLRLNPYGMRHAWDIRGYGNAGLDYVREVDWVFSANLDWQIGRHNRVRAGSELAIIDARRLNVQLFTGLPRPFLVEPVRGALFLTDRLDLGDVVIDAGLRWDYFDPRSDLPRVPGFVTVIPDSLKADFVRLLPGDEPLLDRLAPLEDCGGAETAANRTRPDGTLVCKPNFVSMSKKSVFSPRLGVSFPVTAKSTFRLSYSHNVQVPALLGGGGGFTSAPGQVALLQNQNTRGGSFGRDVALPRTVVFEAGYRQLIGQDFVLDLAVYSKTLRNGLTVRSMPFEDPNQPGLIVRRTVVTNKGFANTTGVDFRLDKRFGQFADISVNYSLIDARGTSSDPFTFVRLSRGSGNVSAFTGEPEEPPEVLLELDQSRRHNVGATFSLLFPAEIEGGTALRAILSDLGIFATVRVASGLLYTRTEDTAGGFIGPPTSFGRAVEALNASSLPWERRFDLRVSKGFRLSAMRMRLFADWRNPLDLTNTNAVFTQTGTTRQESLVEELVNAQLADPFLDGDSDIDDFDILTESPENELNRFSLLQAERRYGNGDGIYTVAEQREAFGAWVELMWGPQWLKESNQRLRLGMEILF